MKDSLDYLLSAGYERVGVETFQEMVVELFEQDILQFSSVQSVESLFRDKGESEHIVWYARVLCAAFMKKNADRFLPFLAGDWSSVEEYCSLEVEPQGKECEQPQIIALAEVLQVRVVIEYISASELAGGQEQVCLGPDSSESVVKLLYRPGHYDILYD